MNEMKTYQNFIGGEWVTSNSSRRVPNINPANNDDLLGELPLSNSEDAVAAAEVAAQAFRAWRAQPAPKRGAIVTRTAHIVSERREAIARTLTREEGKPLS